MKFVSIMGDSISTYAAYNPSGYAVFYDREARIRNGLRSIYDTWWGAAAQALHLALCVNGSFSGSRVTGIGFPAACSAERAAALHIDECRPDVILVYMGYNDFANGVIVRRTAAMGDKDPLVFMDAYEEMLSALHGYYPHAKLVCGTLMRTRVKGKPDWVFPEAFAGIPLEEYNDAIRQVCEKQGCLLADLGAAQTRCETLDGSHPTAAGHAALADAWLRCLRETGWFY